MKLVAVSSVMASLASADLLSLVKTLESQLNNQTAGRGAQFRNFDNIWDGMNGIMSTLTEQITGAGDYGCWCYFASNNGYVGNGFGQPVDTYDRACKTLHDNYACMALDDSTCDPYTVAYNVPANWIALIPSTDDLAGPCATSNAGDTCAANACASESAFVKTFLAENGALSADFQHTNVAFDPTTSCALSNGFSSWSATRGDKACCGSYPNRQIFYNGNKACCGDMNIYNTATKQCCVMDNSVRNNDETCPQPPQVCVEVMIHPTNSNGAGINAYWDVNIDDGNEFTIRFPAQSYSQGNSYTQCADMTDLSKTVNDIVSVSIQHEGATTGNGDGGLFAKFEISYDNGAAQGYGLGDADGFWIDGDTCPSSGHPCCDNGQLCVLSAQSYNRMAGPRAGFSVSEDN